MSRPRVLTAIDVGTDKCTTLIAIVDDQTDELQVKGVAAVPTKGMRKSMIVDLEKVVSTMTESLDAAERMAGFEVKSAFVSVAGTHIHSQNSKGVVAVASPNQEITQNDVERVIEAARAISLPSDRTVIHTIPRDFTVDSQKGIKDPVGMTGIRLEAEAHIITGMSTVIKNLEKCVHDLGLALDGFVFAGLASSEVTLSETEKELGVALLDIGSGSSSLCVFVEGVLEHSVALPIGARHITQDIALGCRLSLDAAEKIKLALSSMEHQTPMPRSGESKEELNKRRKRADKIDLKSLDIDESGEPLSKKTLVDGIMLPRMKEIFSLVGQELQKNNLLSLIPAGLVLCGGGAQTVKIREAARRTLSLPARVGQPTELNGLVRDIQTPSFATSIGLLMYAKSASGDGPPESSFSLPGAINPKGLLNKLTGLFKSVMP